MTDAVDQTLRLWRTTPFIWGSSDCIMSVANHILTVSGVDPAAPWRGKYDKEIEAEEIVSKAGGIAALWDACSDVVRAATPLRGDVLVIWTGAEEVVGLCTGQSAAFRLERGVKEIDLRFLTVVGSWKV